MATMMMRPQMRTSILGGTRRQPCRLLHLRALSTTRSTYAQASVFNSLSGKNEVLPREQAATPHVLKWYSCGPTVYDKAHLGHARAYVSQDILRRIMEKKFQHNVFLVMGVTDVDDKIIKRAQENQVSFLELARREEAAFFDDMERLHVRKPNALTRVSEHMPEIISYVEQIQAKGFAYRAKDGSGVYFDTQQLGDAYGKLDPMRNTSSSAADVQAADVEGDSVSNQTKKDRRDFSLWKALKFDGEPFWDSPWGKGRPGWHIECSAMTHYVLGDKIDVHSGGVDLRFPHHNNEIAQCEAHNCVVGDQAKLREWCRHFIHFGHLYISGLKMSKSLKNFISIQDYLKMHSADQFRIFCLQFKYRANIHYSDDRIRDANVVLDRLKSFLTNAEVYASQMRDKAQAKRCSPVDLSVLGALWDARVRIDAALADDFDTPQALHILLELIAQVNAYLVERQGDSPSEVVLSVTEYVLEMSELFGLEDLVRDYHHVKEAFKINPNSSQRERQSVTPGAPGIDSQRLLQALVQFRSKVREQALQDPSLPSNKQILRLCDDIRNDDLPQLGVQVDDLAAGRSVFKIVPVTSTTKKPADDESDEKDEIKQQLERKQRTFESMMQIAPVDLFREAPEYAGTYASFDADGVPLQAADDNEPLTKSQRKKLAKKMEKHKKSYEKYWKQQNAQ
ncbi:TPA: hypothetical protein N0F65_007834 [Lagenidium giganteum]|uniref:cysteine--tRNA ligase n=1 Tax=Lagenidium giganteum TaxID=4803 RepID=A0AAV2Z4A1_9STRA|nr:TPA: hypothetical protein N0F65_007834 [Lagenidium giganteum]